LKIVYIGRHGAVSIPCPNGLDPTVKWGDIFDTAEYGDSDGSFARGLLEQTDNWAKPPKGAAAKPKEGEAA
jgi:hypothetical protein